MNTTTSDRGALASGDAREQVATADPREQDAQPSCLACRQPILAAQPTIRVGGLRLHAWCAVYLRRNARR